MPRFLPQHPCSTSPAEHNWRAACAPQMKMSILQPRVAREFGIRQTRVAEEEFVRANVHRGEKIVCAGSADDIVLIDAVTADSNGANEHAVAIKRETTREDGDSIWQVGDDPSAHT